MGMNAEGELVCFKPDLNEGGGKGEAKKQTAREEEEEAVVRKEATTTTTTTTSVGNEKPADSMEDVGESLEKIVSSYNLDSKNEDDDLDETDALDGRVDGELSEELERLKNKVEEVEGTMDRLKTLLGKQQEPFQPNASAGENERCDFERICEND